MLMNSSKRIVLWDKPIQKTSEEHEAEIKAGLEQVERKLVNANSNKR